MARVLPGATFHVCGAAKVMGVLIATFSPAEMPPAPRVKSPPVKVLTAPALKVIPLT